MSARIGQVIHRTSDGLMTWTNLLEPDTLASFRDARLHEVAPELLTQMRRTRRTLNAVKSAYATARRMIDTHPVR